METIATSRLILRPVQQSDLTFIKQLFSDSEVKKYYILRVDLANSIDLFVQYLVQTMQVGSGLEYVVKTKGETPIGIMGGELINNRGCGPIWDNSYAILPEYRGMGYATEALVGFTNYIKRFNINTAILDISEYNEASASVARKAGYEKVLGIGNMDHKHPELGLRFDWTIQLHSKRDEYFTKATIAFKSKDYRTAESLYQQALEYENTSNGPFTDAYCYSNMGMACSSYGNYMKAYQCLKKAQSLGLNNASIEKELNWLRVNKGVG